MSKKQISMVLGSWLWICVAWSLACMAFFFTGASMLAGRLAGPTLSAPLMLCITFLLPYILGALGWWATGLVHTAQRIGHSGARRS